MAAQKPSEEDANARQQPQATAGVPARRKYDSERQKQRQGAILAAARGMLDREGYSGMTMRGLAKEAGVAQGTLYNLYSSKDDLILAAVEDLLADIGERAVADNPVPGIPAILNMSRLTGEATQATPRYAEAIARSTYRAQPDDPLIDVLFTRSLPFLVQHLRIAEQQDQLRAGVDVELLARHLVGQMWGVMLLWMMGMLETNAFVTERLRSDLMTLIGVTSGTMRSELEQRYDALDAA
ncbi:MAG: TetR/AcrR family transcriptional regulator [Pseudomonadales bacterium]